MFLAMRTTIMLVVLGVARAAVGLPQLSGTLAAGVLLWLGGWYLAIGTRHREKPLAGAQWGWVAIIAAWLLFTFDFWALVWREAPTP